MKIELVKKIAGATAGGTGVVALFLALHGDLKASISKLSERVRIAEEERFTLYYTK